MFCRWNIWLPALKALETLGIMNSHMSLIGNQPKCDSNSQWHLILIFKNGLKCICITKLFEISFLSHIDR